MRIARRSPHDREIVRLAVPAFFALIAEPLYLLADTAIVGHLGTSKFAGFAIAGAVLTAAFGIFNFLAYSTTSAVARQIGAGNRKAAAHLGVDGLWLAVGLGVVLTVLGLVFAPAIADVMGASARAHPFAVTYLRISILGAPLLLLTLAGAGYLRGTQDTRTTLVIAVAANAVNLLLEVVLVYGLDLGLAGSAWGTVPRPARRRGCVRVGDRACRPPGGRLGATRRRRHPEQRGRREPPGGAYRIAPDRVPRRGCDRGTVRRRRHRRPPDRDAGELVPRVRARRHRHRRAGDGREVPRRRHCRRSRARRPGA